MRLTELYQLETLVSGGLWFSRIDTFKDDLEGSLPKRNLGLLEKLLPEGQVEQVVREYQSAARRAYANCWTMSDGDPSAEMWDAHFGNRGKSIAVKSTPAALLEAIQPIRGQDGPAYLGQIRYINHEIDQIPEAQTLEAFFVVQEDFRFQNEARLLIYSYGSNAVSKLTATSSIWGTPLVRAVPKEQSETKVTEFVGFIPETASAGARLHDGKAIVLPVEAANVRTILQKGGLQHLIRKA